MSLPRFFRICEKYNGGEGGEWHEKGRDKRTKVNGVFHEFSIPFIVSVRPFVAATSYGKKAGADPRTEGRLPANFSKARATPVAIIPNEKVTAALPPEQPCKTIDAVFYILRLARDVTCSRDITDACLSIIREARLDCT